MRAHQRSRLARGIAPWIVAVVAAMAVFGRAEAQRRPFTKGPYLQDVRADGVTVSVELARGGDLLVRATDPNGGAIERRRAALAAGDVAHVELDGLRPATRYAYEVTLGGAAARGAFVTPPAEGTVLPPSLETMVVYGDDRSQHDVHARVVRSIREAHPTLLLHTGDLVEDGSDPDHWQTFFDIERELLASAPAHIVLGNHEIGSGGDIELWRRYVRTAGGSPRPDRYWAASYGHVRIVGVDSNDDFSDGRQRAWLDRELRDARTRHRARLVFVMAHHGPYSSGRHGDHRAMAREGVTSLLERHHIDLFLQGHDHVYERGESAAGLKYVISGGAGAPLYPWLTRSPRTRAFEAAYHHVRLVVRDTAVALTAVRPDGSILDRCSFQGTGRWRCNRNVVPPDEPFLPPWVRRSWILAVVAAASALTAVWLVMRIRARRAG